MYQVLNEHKSMKDILMFMTDQHTPYYSGFYGERCVDTPNFTRLAERGVTFDECYSVCPLCTPARISMLSGKRPARTGLFHRSTMADTTPTFLHNMVEQGYETVLVGRMHFTGKDQYHGFTKHLAGDMTPVTWNYFLTKDIMDKERGVYTKADTFSGHGAYSLAGGGTSPVLEFDQYVIETALNYMNQEHERPQLICVSLYGPHFPYVAPKHLFKKYLDRVKLPETFYDKVHCSILEKHQGQVDENMELACLAAYCGMIEQVDQQFGQIWQAFEAFCTRRGTEHAVFYISDHGDQCGDRKLYGKENFYEKSVKIPWIAAGSGIAENIHCQTPVSIMDFGPTILEYTGAKPMIDVDGVTVAGALHGNAIDEHPVYSEFIERLDGRFFFMPADENSRFSHGFMLRKGDYKFITYEGFEDEDTLFNIRDDAQERHNLIGEAPEVLADMQSEVRSLAMHETAIKNFLYQDRVDVLMSKYEQAAGAVDFSLQWSGCSAEAGEFPEICIKNQEFFNHFEK